MKIFCKELNKEFSTKEEMFIDLMANQNKIIELKKAAIKESDSINSFFADKNSSEKSLSFVKDGYFYPVINTTNFLDSHGDVHFPNIWNKSLKDKVNKIFYVLEHKLSIDNVVAFPNDVNAFVKSITWKELGYNFEGNTQALIYEIAKDRIQISKIKELIDNKAPFENSVRMRYITMALAINTTNSDMSKNKELWDDRIDQIANRDKAEQEGYFWAIDEASIEKEGSLVLFGSNSATPIIYEAGEPTSDKSEPFKDTQTKNEIEFINFNTL